MALGSVARSSSFFNLQLHLPQRIHDWQFTTTQLQGLSENNSSALLASLLLYTAEGSPWTRRVVVADAELGQEGLVRICRDARWTR
jgi:hypothetical protein